MTEPKWQLVGEQGPELVTLPAGSYVHPSDDEPHK